MTPRVLLIGGLDPSGGAGITLDAAVAALHGVEPLPVAAALTVQGRRGFVRQQPVPGSLLRDQVRIVLDDGPVQAVKLGLLGDVHLLERVLDVLALLPSATPWVIDPVLSATSGGLRVGDELAQAYVEWLAPRATLLTPNLPELARLAPEGVAWLLRRGAAAVLVKGGHGEGAQAVDVLHTAEGQQPFVRPRLGCGPVRGTGCALATAIAARLASGAALIDACRLAGDWLGDRLAAVVPRADGLASHLLLRGGTCSR